MLAEFLRGVHCFPEDEAFRRKFAMEVARLPVPAGEVLDCVGVANDLLGREVQALRDRLLGGLEPGRLGRIERGRAVLVEAAEMTE